MKNIVLNLVSYSIPSGESHISTEWEVSIDDTFTNIIYNTSSVTDLLQHTALINNITSDAFGNVIADTEITTYARARITTNVGVKGYAAVSVEASSDIKEPIITIPGYPYSINLTPIINTSAYISTDDTNIHRSTDWIIYSSDTGHTIWESINDVNNKVTITIPAGVLDIVTNYILAVRHNGVTSFSDYGFKRFMVSVSSLPSIVNPTLTVLGEPGPVDRLPSLSGSPFTVVNGTDTHVSTDWIIEDALGNVWWESLGDTTALTTKQLLGVNLLMPNTEYKFTVRYNGAVVSSDYVMEYHHTNNVINLWEATTPYVVSVQLHRQVELNDGRAMVVGGVNSNQCRVFNSAGNTWSSLTDYPTNIHDHSMSTLSDGKVLVVGGVSVSSAVNVCNIYDPATGTWSTATNYPTAVRNHTQSTLHGGKVLVVGGNGSNLCNIYDPITGTWTPTTNYPAIVADHTQSTLLDGRVMVVGGNGNVCNIYDPTDESWSLVANYPTTISKHTQTTIQDGRVLIIGGAITPTSRTSACNIYDPTNNTWTIASPYMETFSNPTGTNVVDHSASVIAGNRVLVVGGWEVTNTTPNNYSNIFTP